MIRHLDIDVDASSWPHAPVPPALMWQLSRPWDPDVRVSLLFTALCTRPPVTYGFHLADSWAWLRYGPAIADTIDLRLRPEWEDVDSHQKTILSDELGVGLTTHLLASTLDFRLFFDTRYFIRVLEPGRYRLRRTAKRGPRKSPDYVARDGAGRYSVIECKGGQSSRKQVIAATEAGIAQKRNLLPTRVAPAFEHTLVAGAFIPQFRNRERAQIYLQDPEWDQLSLILAEIPENRVIVGAGQIAVAKHLALAGLTDAANALATTPTVQLERGPDFFDRPLLEEEAAPASDRFEVARLIPQAPGRDAPEREIRFAVRGHAEVYERLRASRNLARTLYEMVRETEKRAWEVERTAEHVEVRSPLDFVFTLDYPAGDFGRETRRDR